MKYEVGTLIWLYSVSFNEWLPGEIIDMVYPSYFISMNTPNNSSWTQRYIKIEDRKDIAVRRPEFGGKDKPDQIGNQIYDFYD